jgi:hypothetical protein
MFGNLALCVAQGQRTEGVCDQSALRCDASSCARAWPRERSMRPEKSQRLGGDGTLLWRASSGMERVGAARRRRQRALCGTNGDIYYSKDTFLCRAHKFRPHHPTSPGLRLPCAISPRTCTRAVVSLCGKSTPTVRAYAAALATTPLGGSGPTERKRNHVAQPQINRQLQTSLLTNS